MDAEWIIAGLESMGRGELIRLELALERRLQELGKEPKKGSVPMSGVVEYRSYADGMLQAEIRRYVRKDGSMRE
jgi:hypothetical protein